MQVKLISITESKIKSEKGEALTPEELIVYIARVSNPSNQMNTETSDKLLGYLIRNKHWSPLEQASLTVEIVTSRGIAQQILRHRSFSFQEFSQRYAEVTDFEPVQLRKKATTNRQSSEEEFNPITLKWDTHATGDRSYREAGEMTAQEDVQGLVQHAEMVYKRLLDAGVAKECARFVLPITTQTKIYMTGSIRSWVHYLQIRCDEHTQLEHRQIADEIQTIFKLHFPNISKALGWV
jgi:thymidylate synthase (FAD)